MSGRRRKNKNSGDDSEDWMTTYADAITLLLCFFVIILNIAEPTPAAFEELRLGFMAEFTSAEVETPFSDIYDAFESIVDQNQLQEDISIEETPKGIMLEFDSASIFRSGSADIMPRAYAILDEIALQLTRFEYDHYGIEVEGHTDDVPIRGGKFPSNWELSSARASSVVRYFIEKNVDQLRLKASGFADTKPKLPNLDSFGNAIPANRAENRRIIVRLERE